MVYSKFKIREILRADRQKSQLSMIEHNKSLQAQAELMEQINNALCSTVLLRTQELEERNRELNMFLYRTSHDIRGPVATIIGLKRIFDLSTHDSDATMIFERIVHVANKLDSIVFKFSRLHEIQSSILVLKPTNFGEVIDKVVDSFSVMMQQHNINLIFEGSEKYDVLGDSRMLEIIVEHIVENAITFTSVNKLGRSIKISQHVIDENLVVSIEDNGVGIDEKVLSRVFDAYFRGSEVSAGSGLGLFIVKKACQRLGLEIKLCSQEWVGTTVSLFFEKFWVHPKPFSSLGDFSKVESCEKRNGTFS